MEKLTPPAMSPAVTVREVKFALNLVQDNTYEDVKLNRLISAATEHYEDTTGQALVYQDFAMYADEWPRAYEELQIPIRPLSSVEQITYWDGTTSQTVDPSVYSVNRPQGTLSLEPSQSWPDDLQYKKNAIRIDFRAGYGVTANDVPDDQRQAVITLVGQWYFDPAGEGNTHQDAFQMLRRSNMRTSYP